MRIVGALDRSVAKEGELSMQGVWLRDYESMSARKSSGGEPNKKETLGNVAPSNAYKRRVSGVNWQ